MRKAARTIVIHDDKLLVMKRDKFGMKYCTLIGGNVDLGETPEQTAVREMQEETGVAVNNLRLVFVEEAGDLYGTQYIYLADYVSGQPQLDPKSIEAELTAKGKNLYEPAWLPLSELPDAPFRSETLKQALLRSLKSGYPTQPETLQTTQDIRYNKPQ
jgi:8-oxo-dGTP diphosphatase